MALADPLDPLAPPDPAVPPVTPPATAPVATPPATTPPVTPPVTPPTTGLATSAPDSVAAQVELLLSKDSKLNQMARTEGLKAANRRGLLNSSMAVGSAQDAVLKNVLPIAAQDATQLFQANQAKALRDWQTAEAIAGRNWTTGERLGTQEFQTLENIAQRGFVGDQAELDRVLQQALQDGQITSAQLMQTKQIASTEGIAAAGNQLQKDLQASAQAFTTSERIGTQGFITAERLGSQEFAHTEAELQDELEKLLQGNQITSTEAMYYAGIVSTEGIEAARQKLQADLFEKDIQFRMEQGQLTREAAADAQQKDLDFQAVQGELNRAQELNLLERDLAFREKNLGLDRAAAAVAQDKEIKALMETHKLDRASAERMHAAGIKADIQIRALDRATQEKVASWGVSVSNKGAMAQYLTNVNSDYNDQYATIMNNTNLSPSARTTQLNAAKAKRNVGMNLAEQIWGTNLTW